VRERYADFGPTPACAGGGLLVAEKLHEAARRLRALDIGEIEITDCAQRFPRRACLKVLRQSVQPGPVTVAVICAAFGRRHLSALAGD
jgi:hypothetical protein